MGHPTFTCRCGDALALDMDGWILHRMEHAARALTYWGDAPRGGTD